MKKLSKVLPEDEVKNMDSIINDLLKKQEEKAKKECDAKEAELKQAWLLAAAIWQDTLQGTMANRERMASSIFVFNFIYFLDLYLNK